MSNVQCLISNKKDLKRLAKNILDFKPNIIALEGPLGAGKTTLTKEIAKQLGIKDEVTSPTFVLHSSYPLFTINYSLLHHIDCWRMEDFSELENIGLGKMLSPNNIVVIEWADKFKDQIQNLKSKGKVLWVKLEYTKNRDERLVAVK